MQPIRRPGSSQESTPNPVCAVGGTRQVTGPTKVCLSPTTTLVGHALEPCSLDLLWCLKGSARSRWRAAPCPRHDILSEPNWTRAKPRNGCGEIRPLCVACRGSLGDTQQFGDFSQSQELQRHRP